MKNGRIDLDPDVLKYLDIQATSNSDSGSDDEDTELDMESSDIAQDQEELPRFHLEQQDWVAEAEYLEKISDGIHRRHKRLVEITTNRIQVDLSDTLQISSLPTVDDSPLWLVPAAAGEEQAALFILTNRILLSERRQSPILSAFVRPSLVGKLYVEARCERDVRQACQGISALQTHRIVHVPIHEALALLNLNVDCFTVAKGDWVRFKSGLYRKDLGLVVGVDVRDPTQNISVAVVPRLNLASNERKRKKGFKERAPKQLFDYEEIIKLFGQESVKKRNQILVFKKQTFKNGLLELDVRLEELVQELAIPTLGELSEFARSQTVEPELINATLTRNPPGTLCLGERVEVICGEWKGKIGTIKSLHRNQADIQFTDENLGVDGQLPVTAVVKHFRVQDYVKVREGLEIGKSGWVLARVGPCITFYDRSAAREITVMARSLDFHSVEISMGTSRVQHAIQCDPKDPLTGRHVIAFKGHYKAYRGIIKDTNHFTGTARVELEAGQRLKSFKLTDLLELASQRFLGSETSFPRNSLPPSASKSTPIYLTTPSTPLPPTMFSPSVSPAWNPSSRTPRGKDEGACDSNAVARDWLAHPRLRELKILVKFNRDWLGGSVADCLGYTVPSTSSGDGQRTHVDVQMRNRKMTLHHGVPIKMLNPVHPVGPGERVVVIHEDRAGDIFEITKKGTDGFVFVSNSESLETSLAISVKHLALIRR